ncbi:hypothetical protein ABEB36_005989 [Hypothenemus hampei]|uniref:Cyclic nucleotide-binding domain-containing protein n=1 Tax=Hypothenemus hampei TaxID=57062 RepID=A0ABD1F061_HYPHA
MAKPNIHCCDLKLDTFGLPKLPPNVSWYRKFGRTIRKFLTLNPNSRSAKRFFRNRSTMIAEQRRHLSGPSYIIHPFSNFNRVREIIFCILWITEMIISPIYMSFVHVEGTYYSRTHEKNYRHDKFFFFYTNVLSPMEACCTASFFITGYINVKTKDIVIQPRKICKHYLCTYYIIDYLMNLKFGIYTDITRYMYLINMTCMLRAGTVFDYLREIVLNCKMPEDVYDCVRLFVITLIILNSFACFYYYLPWILGGETFSVHSWPVRANASIENGVPIFQAYTESMLCIICHFFATSQGLHDTDLRDGLQKILLVIVMISELYILGRMWTLYVIAHILKIFGIFTISESKYEEYLLQLEVFMRQKRLPQVLRNRLHEYYRYKYQHHFFNEQAIFATLSAYLRQDLLLFGARKLIAKSELFRAFPRSVMAAVIANSRQIVFLPNDYIAKREVADEIYFISSGTVAITNLNNEEVGHAEDGDEIGLIGAFSPPPYIYRFNYYAVETTEVYCITYRDFWTLVSDQEDLLKHFSKKVEEKIDTYFISEQVYQVHGFDLLSELSSGKILERPRLRPTHFDN